MITPPAIPGFTFSKLPHEDLIARFLAIPEWVPELLGQSVNGRPIYGFALGDPALPTMYVQGGIHGYHEWRNPWWVSQFMMYLADPGLLPSHQAILTNLRSRYSFYFIPDINADGYGTPEAAGSYTNASGVSISENFDVNWDKGVHTPPHDEYRGPAPWSEPESQIVRDKILDILPVSLLCNHTWGSTTVGYTTRHPQNAGDDAAITEMWDQVNVALAYGDDYTKTYSARLPSGSAYNWAGTLDCPDTGRPIIAQVWESGGGQTVEDQSRVGMTGILYHMLMVDSMIAQPAPFSLAEVSSWGPIRVGGYDQPVTSVSYVQDGAPRRIWP